MRLGAGLAMFGIAALATGAHAQPPSTSAGAPITVVVEDIRIPGGMVRVDVCTRETFLKETCPYSGAAPALVGTTRVTVEGVPPGTYAIQAFHDINNNNRVDQGLFGVPKEGLAFSNDAPLGLRGPSFDRAAISHGDEPQTLHLKLRHFRHELPPSAASPHGD